MSKALAEPLSVSGGRGLDGGNGAYPWDQFDPQWYVEHNYRELRYDDRRILQHVRDFFHEAAAGIGVPARGIDVGSGSNLYPALAMLPFCGEVTLFERGESNCRWLNNEIWAYSPFWDAYWDILSTKDVYAVIERPRVVIRDQARVQKGDLFKLPLRRWDIGTMFFVAESISEQEREFKAAVERFIGSLKPGAPFAAAFMRGSLGYYVDRLRFPAVAVSEADVEHCLVPFVDDLEIRSVYQEAGRRSGYTGMILALGRRARG